MLKKCKECGESKEISEFRKRDAIYYNPRCKLCDPITDEFREKRKLYIRKRRENPEIKQIDRDSAIVYYKKNKAAVLERIYKYYHSIPPGVYGIKHIPTDIWLYIGESKIPKKRFSTHSIKYNPNAKNNSPIALYVHEGNAILADLEFIMLSGTIITKKERLIIEGNLIKELQPLLNIVGK